MNNLKKIGVLALMTAAVCMTASAQQFSKAEDAIKYRKSALTIMGANFTQLSAMAQGKAPYDAKLAVESAAIVEFVAKLPWTAFVEGSDKGETKAKGEIWTEQAKFKEAQDKLLAESQKLAVAAKSGKLEELKVAVAATGGSCKNCHDNFKNK